MFFILFILSLILIYILYEIYRIHLWLKISVEHYEKVGKLNQKRKMDENDCKK